jgi:hypothetical protein
VEEHAFKTLKEKKLKNMAARSVISHRFSRDDMENVIKGGWNPFKVNKASFMTPFSQF